jgi:nicotinate-nucleotide adenylyltransferase
LRQGDFLSSLVSSGTEPLGLLGGTFDPIHFGHLRLAEECADSLRLNEIRLIPASKPWQRSGLISGIEHRLEMVRLGVEGNPRLRLDARESERIGPSYTVDTLAGLRAELGETRPMVMIVGSDQFLNLPTWHRWQKLFEFAHIAVARRANESFDLGELPAALAAMVTNRLTNDRSALAEPSGRVFSIEMTPLKISSSQIRTLVRTRQSPRYLLPGAVYDYILKHGLYQ